MPGGLESAILPAMAGSPSYDVLTRADAEPALPRLGGMARPDGVVVVSDRFWAFAGADGTLREGAMPAPWTPLQRVPLLRGLVKLGASLSPLFRRSGVARPRERYLLLAIVLAPFGLYFAPDRLATPVGIALTAVLVGWMLRGRTLNLHGAEHRAIAAVEERRLSATWEGEARPSRFAARCGTNFAVLVLPVAAFAQAVWPLPFTVYTPFALALLSLAVTMELWLAIESSGRRILRAFLLPGLGLQRVTTREPSLAETRLALCATASVLRRELADS